MALARLKQSLTGPADRRAAAYAELTALAHGDAADATTGLAGATLHVGGLEGEALEDEAQLAERLGTFGTVLAVTLRRRREAEKVSWALVKLLSDEELFTLEDTVADYVELQSSMGVITLEAAHAIRVADKLVKLVALSEHIVADGAFSRQARRKYL
eukprot:COSAG04_NODE_373_length_15636_cov_4.260732_7_plen_157_part_00